MEILQYVIALLAGCGVFIAGMNMMSDGLEKSTGSGLKKLLGRISNNRFAGVGVGAAVTALVQSSSATSVMAIGFVNAGAMTLSQATAIIMGANIGTTVTGLIVSLSAFDISLYASLLAFIGVMMMFFKNQKVKNIGGILCGLGLLFVGLDLMSNAFGNDQIKDFFAGVFAQIDFPLLLILMGIVFTALVQSSSAATGLIIIMVGKGAISVSNALFIVLGSNIGTCITAILASIGTTTNAKRTAFIHFLFNLIGTILFTIILWTLNEPIVNFLESIFSNTQMQIAWFHVIFNLTTTIILIPFINQLVKLATLVIKDKKSEEEKYHLQYVDERLLKTPVIALMQVKKEVENMALLAKNNLDLAFEQIKTQDGKNVDSINETEDYIDFVNNALTKYLIKLTSLVDGNDEKVIGAYFHVINDIERMGDHAENFLDLSLQMKERELKFSNEALEELSLMYSKIRRMYDIAMDVFDNKSHEGHLKELDALEDEVDELKNHLQNQHFTRLSSGECVMELSAFYSSTIAGLERVGDHLVNVGYSIVNPTGDELVKTR